MKVLLDHMLPHELRFLLDGEVFTAQYMGLDEHQNGELLEACDQRGIDVLVTHDKGLRHQQELSRYRVAVLQLDALSNNPKVLLPLVPQVNEALETIQPGDFVVVG